MVCYGIFCSGQLDFARTCNSKNNDAIMQMIYFTWYGIGHANSYKIM